MCDVPLWSLNAHFSVLCAVSVHTYLVQVVCGYGPVLKYSGGTYVRLLVSIPTQPPSVRVQQQCEYEYEYESCKTTSTSTATHDLSSKDAIVVPASYVYLVHCTKKRMGHCCCCVPTSSSGAIRSFPGHIHAAC